MGTPFLVCALTVGLFVMGEVNAQEKSTPDSVSIAIQKLASKRFRDRNEGSLTLAAIGRPALKALKEAAQSSDAEVRERAEALARKIETQVRDEMLAQAKTPAPVRQYPFDHRSGAGCKKD